MNFQVTAFDPTVLQQTQPKSCNSSLPFRIGFRGRNQYAEPPHAVALLRTRDERPRCSAPDRRNELAPPHSITSSARLSSAGGTVMPKALAVLRLIVRRLHRQISRFVPF